MFVEKSAGSIKVSDDDFLLTAINVPTGAPQEGATVASIT